MAKPLPYLRAQDLRITPAERKAMIAFVEAPAAGPYIAMNSGVHYYNQGFIDSPESARSRECSTAGCVAGFVFWHITGIQNAVIKDKDGHEITTPEQYIGSAISLSSYLPHPLFSPLYRRASPTKLREAQAVVAHALRTGKVVW